MSELNLWSSNQAAKLTARDIVAPLFRHKRLVLLAFGGVLLGTILFSVLWAARYYEAKMQVLVELDRSDPAITPGQNAAVLNDKVITPDQISSEVALLSGRDILSSVAKTCGLGRDWAPGDVFLPRDPSLRQAAKLEKATINLAKALDVESEKTSDIVNVTYGATGSPETPACVLKNLSTLYMQKHLLLQRPSGTSEFFSAETEKFRSKLAESEARLVQLSREQGIAAPDVVRQYLAQQLANSIAALHQAHQMTAADEQRIRNVQSQMQSTPSRSPSQQMSIPADTLLQQLRANLLVAQTKRTGLAMKYDASYPLVQEADQEIAETEAAIAEAEKIKYVNQTTDRDGTYELLRQDLAKDEADLASQTATGKALEQSIKGMQLQLINLDQEAVQQGALMRDVKANEASYLLYLEKREQERTADALDEKRIANVAIAVPPVTPVLPAHSPLLVAFVGFVLAVVVSTGTAYVAEYLDPTFRVPDEVVGLLEIPVLAALPKLKA